jgi:excisionase family DNA binding protein
VDEKIDQHDVARYLGVSTRTVRNLIKRDELPPPRIGRKQLWLKEKFTRWLHDGTASPPRIAVVVRNAVPVPPARRMPDTFGDGAAIHSGEPVRGRSGRSHRHQRVTNCWRPEKPHRALDTLPACITQPQRAKPRRASAKIRVKSIYY